MKSLVPVTVSLVLVMATADDYLQERAAILAQESTNFLGGNNTLTVKEKTVNKIILEAKNTELSMAYNNSRDFLPALHFPRSKNRINKSPVFSIIRKLPKGASLHTHLLAAASVDYLIGNITYRENLYGGFVNNVFKLKFLQSPESDTRCNWTLVKELRDKETAPVFDQWLRSLLTLTETYPNVETVWDKFKKIFTTTYDMLAYRPVFEDYLYQVLRELHDDNVIYTELKGTIMPLYELDGTTHSKEEFFQIFANTVERFKSDFPAFTGAKYIHSIYRGVENDVLKTALEEIIELRKHHPDLIAGFDFVGFEEEGCTLFDYHLLLLEAGKHLNFFFHAGETNWFGHTDLNLLDAILLNTSRIGHGFALVKHPKMLQLAKSRNIALEICPISNQVLMLNQDHRNHPAAVLMALGFPVVIGNDDPSIWDATGLSYDWFMVFMAMTPRDSGLEVLKQLAINSIVYSSMGVEEKRRSLEVWEGQWDKFLDEILKTN
ncbi:adenosine deaminase 2-A [Tribolium castaneum]|uniref:Adenosine deaminase n=1 Tax=Tribolium castaneum TaxID=7070 RepID=D6WEK1_TRICA|nr:PREDICTED: adenosine deaminase CECR1-A [Tribolium castaneum]EFA00339.1 Adenosine deaminase CECR1-A-like Protein [Tribolium castaneum]|eukprot:XP_008190579.1 PREDICTED: adenosine deaminase CECR1-A [Tribolium castaneum]